MRVKADGDKGWFKLSREFPAALAATRMSPACHAIVQVIFCRSYALPNPQAVSTVNRAQLGRLLSNFSDDALTAGTRELLARNILHTDGPTRTGYYLINTTVTEWEGLDQQVFRDMRKIFEHMTPPPDVSEPPEAKRTGETAEPPEPIANEPLSPQEPAKTRVSLQQIPDSTRENAGPNPQKRGSKPAKTRQFSTVLEKRRETPPLPPLEPGAETPRIEDAPSAQKAHSRTARTPAPEDLPSDQIPSQIDQDQDDTSGERWIIRAGIAALLLDGEFDESDCIRAAAALANDQEKNLGRLDGRTYADAVDGVIRYHVDQRQRGRDGIADLVGACLASFGGRDDPSGPFKPRWPGLRHSTWLKLRDVGDLPIPPDFLTPQQLADWRREWRAERIKRELAEARSQREREAAKARQLEAQRDAEREQARANLATLEAERAKVADAERAAFTMTARKIAHLSDAELLDAIEGLPVADRHLQRIRLQAWLKTKRALDPLPSPKVRQILGTIAAKTTGPPAKRTA